MSTSDQSEEQLFERCLELPPEAWKSFLSSTCAGNEALRESVLSLLRSHQKQGGFLDPVADGGSFPPNQESISTSGEVDVPEMRKRRIKWWILAFVSSGIILLLYVIFTIFSFPADKNDIAVSTFTVLTGESLGEAFPSDLKQAIIDKLAKLEGSKAVTFSNLEEERKISGLPTIEGAEKVAKYQLTGDIQYLSQTLRILTQVVNLSTGLNEWSESYTRKISSSNLPFVAKDIADHVVKGIAPFFGKDDQLDNPVPPSYHPEALTTYTRAIAILETNIKTDIPKAIQELEKATEMDPNFALAFVGLAQAYFQYEQISSDGMSKEDAIRLIKPAIEKARAINENLPPVQEALGSWHLEEGNLVAAEEAFNQALKADPEFADAWMGLAIVEIKKTIPRGYEAYSARMPTIMKQMEKAIALDPEAPGYRTSLGYALSDLGRIEEGIDQFQTSLALNPKYAQAHANLADFAINFQGQFDEALVRMRHALALDPQYLKYWVRTRNLYETLGDSNMALTLTERMLSLREDKATLYQSDFYRLKGEDENAANAMREVVDNLEIDWGQSEKTDARRRLLNYDLRNRLFEEARARYYFTALWLFEENPEVMDYPNAVLASELAAVLLHTDELEQSEKLVDAAWAYFEEIPESYPVRTYQEALMLTLKDEQHRAVQVIEKTIRDGTLSRLDLEDVRLDSLRDFPEFRTAVSQWEKRRAEQLARFRTREANGEVPPIPELTEN